MHSRFIQICSSQRLPWEPSSRQGGRSQDVRPLDARDAASAIACEWVSAGGAIHSPE